MRVTSDQIRQARLHLGSFVVDTARHIESTLGFGWRPSLHAPSSFAELRVAHDLSQTTGRPLPVSSLFCENTIFFEPATNWAMRFWHDSLHVALDRSFERDDEYEVADAQLACLTTAGFGATSLEHRLLRADSIGQTYCADQIGRFPKDQLCFALWCLEDGLEEAVAYEFAKHGSSAQSSGAANAGQPRRTHSEMV